MLEILNYREMRYLCKRYNLKSSFGLACSELNQTIDGKRANRKFPLQVLVSNNTVQWYKHKGL